jgi:uncharacterized protein
MPPTGRRDFVSHLLQGGAAAWLKPDLDRGEVDNPDVVRSVTWIRRDRSGAEVCWLLELPAGPALRGVAVGSDEGRPILSRYTVACTSGWRTSQVEVRVQGSDGSRRRLSMERDPAGGWRIDGVARLDLDGCSDVDLGITPATNTLPIRRLGLVEGEVASPTAAWVRFPDLTVRPLPQTYRNHGRGHYRYRSRNGAFSAELEVDDWGMVSRYGDLWERQAAWP